MCKVLCVCVCVEEKVKSSVAAGPCIDVRCLPQGPTLWDSVSVGQSHGAIRPAQRASN